MTNDNIWPQVQQHRWKYGGEKDAIEGIIWHATRSGIPGRTAAQEYQSAVNWFISPNNAFDVNDFRSDDYRYNGVPFYAGMSNYIIGGGKICLAVPDHIVPRFSAGVHDYRAISIEMGQATNNTPYDPVDIQLAVELAQNLSEKYGFPLGRIPFLDAQNTQLPGEVGHEDTAQGKRQGKSDPGPLFWDAYVKARGEEMSEAEIRAIVRSELQSFFGFDPKKHPNYQRLNDALVARFKKAQQAQSIEGIKVALDPNKVPDC